jgi:hypothetical protein
MSDIQCWFCGQGIERADANALRITLEGLWRWRNNTETADDTGQSIFVHLACAELHLRGNSMDVDPSILGEED